MFVLEEEKIFLKYKSINVFVYSREVGEYASSDYYSIAGVRDSYHYITKQTQPKADGIS